MVAAFPDALVATPVAVLPAEEVRLPAAAVAEVKNEVALLNRPLSRELALASTLLILLSILLWAEGAAAAALDRRLEANDSAEDTIEEASDSSEEKTDPTLVGKLLVIDENSDAADVITDPPNEVASPTTEVASEATESIAEPRLN